MDLDMLVREADPAHDFDPVVAQSDVAQDLLRQILAGETGNRGRPRHNRHDRLPSGAIGQHSWSRSPLVAVAAAVVLLATGLGAVAISQGHRATRSVALKPNPNVKPVAMNWRLVSEISPQIHPFVSTSGSPQGIHSLTCPSARVCYLISSSLSGLPPNALYRSSDGGGTWLPMKLPPGVFLDTSLSCFSANGCIVGAEAGFGSGLDGVAQLLLTTRDGGVSWTTRHVPIPPVVGDDAALNQQIAALQGNLYELQCFTSQSCVAFGTTPTGEPEGGSDGTNFISLTVAMRTDDGGSTWTTHVFPWSTTPSGAPGWSSQQHAAFSCPSALDCVGLARVFAAGPPPADHKSPTYGSQDVYILEFRTTDGGHSWSKQWVPVGEGTVTSLTCPDVSHCVAITHFGPAGANGPDGVLASSDGGGTWTAVQPFPSLNPGWNDLTSISCPTDSMCWLAGSEQSSSDPSETTGVMFASQDGGHSWEPVELPIGLGSVNEVDCLVDQSCLAIGQAPIPNGTVTSRAPNPTLVLTNSNQSRECVRLLAAH